MKTLRCVATWNTEETFKKKKKTRYENCNC